MVALLGAISVSGEVPEKTKAPSIQIGKRNLQAPEGASRVKGVKAEVAEFLGFPPELRRQMLRYGRRWREGISR